MESTNSNQQVLASENDRNVAALVHISTFAKYFFPFGNFIGPLLLWTFNKDKHFVDEHGKQAINFQLSILLYMIFVGLLCIPFVIIFAADFVSLVDVIDHTVHEVHFSDIRNLSGYIILFGIIALLLFGLLLFELYAVISAAIHASRGEYYKYPLSIAFIKSNHINQSKNEHIS